METGALQEGPRWQASCEFSHVESGHIGGALAVKLRLAPGETVQIPLVLAWDLPVIAFGSGREYTRRYTRYFGAEGCATADIAAEALVNWQDWSAQIDAWQQSYLQRAALPRLVLPHVVQRAVFTQRRSDRLDRPRRGWRGGRRFLRGDRVPGLPLLQYPRFVDLRLVCLAAQLARAGAQRHDALCPPGATRGLTPRRHLLSDRIFPTTLSGMAPHDLGAPLEDPLEVVNSYNFQDTTRWKDLNSQLIVTLWHDHLALQDHRLFAGLLPGGVRRTG